MVRDYHCEGCGKKNIHLAIPAVTLVRMSCLQGGLMMSLKPLNEADVRKNSVNPNVDWLSLICLKSTFLKYLVLGAYNGAPSSSLRLCAVRAFQNKVGLVHLLSYFTKWHAWFELKRCPENSHSYGWNSESALRCWCDQSLKLKPTYKCLKSGLA